MIIRRAKQQDIPGLEKLLSQVLALHQASRPDIFRANTRKYTTEQLRQMVSDDERPIFVAVAEDAAPGEIWGYAFCALQKVEDSNVLVPITTLYLDDLCVDGEARGQHVGTRLYEYVVDFARSQGCYNLTLNVWEVEGGARAFYEGLGMRPQKYCMETIL